jgi:enterochelin esterase-like enzyme
VNSRILRNIIIFLHFICSHIFANVDSVTVTFILQSEKLSPRDTVYITGNHKALGSWHPGETALIYNNNSWRWDTEAIFEAGTIPDNFALTVSRDTIIQINVPMWKNEMESRNLVGQITGIVHYYRNISGFGLKPRDLIVWLPPAYELDPQQRYPVLYMHDGQNIFDPWTAAFGVDWQMDETADSLIKSNRIEPIIIVGIYNTTDRAAEYQDTDKARVYMKFLVDVIKPFIDTSYRTKPERAFTSTGGASGGGLISFMLLWEHPQIFSKAACLSPAFKISSIDYVSKVMKSPQAPQGISIYIDCGDIGLEKELQPGVDEMLNALEQKGLVRNTDYLWYLALNQRHNEADWARRVWRFLEFFYPREHKSE